jgi:hypothetical protein
MNATASGTLHFPLPAIHQQIRMRLYAQAHVISLHPGYQNLNRPVTKQPDDRGPREQIIPRLDGNNLAGLACKNEHGAVSIR